MFHPGPFLVSPVFFVIFSQRTRAPRLSLANPPSAYLVCAKTGRNHVRLKLLTELRLHFASAEDEARDERRALVQIIIVGRHFNEHFGRILLEL